jgi:hypothetical protein
MSNLGLALSPSELRRPIIHVVLVVLFLFSITFEHFLGLDTRGVSYDK